MHNVSERCINPGERREECKSFEAGEERMFTGMWVLRALCPCTFASGPEIHSPLLARIGG